MASLKDWLVESLRMTSFPTDAESLGAGAGWWSQLFGSDPDELTVRQKTQLVVNGQFGPGRMVLATSSMPEPRVDLVWSAEAAQQLGSPMEGPLVLGPAGELLDRFSELLAQWSTIGVPTRRCAIGGAYLLPVVDRISGYKALNELLPCVELDPAGSSDFLYQINRPRPSQVLGDKFLNNRLSRWTVSASRRIQFSMQVGKEGPELETKAAGGETYHAVRLETDVNTSADWKDHLDVDRVKLIQIELMTLTSEILVNGDVK